jgi:hypothetical protein
MPSARVIVAILIVAGIVAIVLLQLYSTFLQPKPELA